MEEHPLSLYELNALVKRSIHACLPDTYWVQAELSDVRSNYSGHCYLEFVQKEPRGNNLIAKARGTIWSNVYRLLKPYFEEETGQAFVADKWRPCEYSTFLPNKVPTLPMHRHDSSNVHYSLSSYSRRTDLPNQSLS
jgi:hypothetical protein